MVIRRAPLRQPAGADSGRGLALMIIIAIVAFVVLTAIGALIGHPGLGLLLAGAVPVGYGVLQLLSGRNQRGIGTIVAGATAWILCVGMIPGITQDAGQAGPADATATSLPVPTRVGTTPYRSGTPAAPGSRPATSQPPTRPAPPVPSQSPDRTTQPAPTSAPPTSPTSTGPSRSNPTTAQQLVGLVVVKGRGPKTGYDRRLFAWNGYDFDRNGCDQRNDVLKRDMRSPVTKPGSNGCRVEAGWLQDRYSGEAIWLPRRLVDIDHVVALSNAWVMGAARWPELKRKRFANDPLNLVATTQRMNRQKGDSNAASWLPPANRCDYVARQLAVKWRYGLAMTAPEREAITRILAGCPDHPIPTGDEPAPRQAPSTSPRPTSAAPSTSAPPRTGGSAAAQTDPRFSSCRQAKRNGYGPYTRGVDPEYAWYRDDDSDGVTCE